MTQANPKQYNIKRYCLNFIKQIKHSGPDLLSIKASTPIYAFYWINQILIQIWIKNNPNRISLYEEALNNFEYANLYYIVWLTT